MESGSEDSGFNEGDRLAELREGDKVRVQGGDISSLPRPPWFDPHKFQRAKKVYKEYFASVNFGHMCGLLLSFYFTKNIKTLRSTGESESRASLFHRYLATIRHTQRWYEGDIWDTGDPAHRSLAVVRSMHDRVAKKMSQLGDGVVYVSQWDMALTQWAFVGPIVLFRSKVGLHSCSEEDYDALLHFWRTIGYILGIEDRYNLCHGEYPQVVEACEDVLRKEYRKKVEMADESSVQMGRSVATALSMIDSVLTWESMANYIHDLVGLPCPVRMGLLDHVCNWFMRMSMQYVICYELPRQMFNDLLRWRLDMADKKDLRLMKRPNKAMVSKMVTAS